MSMFAKVFGREKKKKQVVPTSADAIQQLRATEEMLVKKQTYLEKKMEEELNNAKKYGTNNKERAIHALKRKKKYEAQLNQTMGTLDTIEYQREALGNAKMNSELLSTMSAANRSLKVAQRNINADQVHDLMDDIAEQQDAINEITQAMSNSSGFGYGQDIDEDDLFAELEQLEQEKLNEQPLHVSQLPSVVSLPEVPRREPRVSRKSKSKKHEDDDLAQLEAWAAA